MKKTILKLIAAPVILCFLLISPVISGCHTSPDVVAFRAEGVTIPTVNGAMKGWADYVNVGTNGVTQAQVDQVKIAYLKYYDSQLVASNAFVNFFEANHTTDTNAAAIAKNNLEAAIKTASGAQTSILNLLTSFLKPAK